MKWLDLTLPTPAENLACDEVLLDWCEETDGAEILRFWESSQPFVVVGYGNDIQREVDVAACAKLNVPILRRCTGGGTVVQGRGCLNYALVLRIDAELALESITSTNRFVMERNRQAIARLVCRTPDPVDAIDAPVVEGHTDLALKGLKFSGNAQRRRRECLLFHGTFLLNFDLRLIAELLPMPSRQPEYRSDRPHGKFLANLGLDAEAVKASLRESWHAHAVCTGVPLSRVTSLTSEKYGRHDWIWRT